MRSGFIPALWLAGILAGAGSARAQGTITGWVTDTSRGELPGVEVAASNGSVQARAVTDTKGCYELRGLNPGEYVVAVRLAGFAGTSRSSVRVADGQVTTGVDFVMCVTTDAKRDILWVLHEDGLEGAWKKSDLVVHARIVRTAPIVSSCPTSDVQHTVAVIEALKGELPGGRLTFRQEQWAEERTPYPVGQELVLFLASWRGELIRLSGPHYAFPIDGDTVRNRLPDGPSLTAGQLLAALRAIR